MRVHTYVIDHDLGFAPNPFHGVCSLAACKPLIRQFATTGDYVVGTGSVPNKLRGHLIYWMKISDVLTFDQYWKDERFRRKRPVMAGSRMLRYGDNIYHRSPDDNFIQEDSFHSEPNGRVSVKNLRRDTSRTDRVLVGYEYAYWGRRGPAIPETLRDFIHTTQGHRNRYPQDRVAALVAWIQAMPERGYLGRPANWPD